MLAPCEGAVAYGVALEDAKARLRDLKGGDVVTSYLTVEDVAPLLGKSKRALHELTRTGRIPHRVLPYGRRCLFQEDWLDAWADGCELERVDLPGGGRIVRPKGTT